jgi:hypothetical protein
MFAIHNGKEYILFYRWSTKDYITYIGSSPSAYILSKMFEAMGIH